MPTAYTDIFDRYFEQKLSEKELGEFSQRLADDVEFSRAFAEYKTVVKATKLAGEQQIRKTLSAIASEDSQAEAKVIKFRAARMWYAAAVVIVLISTGVWAFLSQGSSPHALYADNFEVYPGLSNTRGDSDLTALWSNFSDSYSAGEYEASLVILGEAEFNDIGPEYLVRFYSGICLMALDQPNFERAITEFDEVLVSDNDFHAQSLWYQGLAYLHMEDLESAKEKFESLQSTSKFKAQEVQEILDDL